MLFLIQAAQRRQVKLPGAEVELFSTGICIRTTDRDLEAISGEYSCDVVPIGCAVYRFLIENEVADLTTDEIMETAARYGLTAEKLERLWGPDRERGMVALQTFFQLATAQFAPLGVVWELRRVQSMDLVELRQYIRFSMN